MSNPILELKKLGCERDGRQLFAALDLQLFPGDILQVEGPNGSGKTSLLRILTTVSHDYQGELHWRGQRFQESRLDYLNHTLYLGHLPGIKKALSPKENLGWYSGMNAGHTQTDIEAALEAVGLYGFEDVPCYSLSAGQHRRVALARLYLTPAQVWVLDEPFTAIDKQGVARLEALIQEHANGGGVVVLTTHQDMSVAGLKKINLMDFQPQPQASDCVIEEATGEYL